MRLLAGALTALALSAPISALAADLPVKAPPIVPVVDLWSGWYIGINGGYSWGRWDSSSLTGIFPGPAGLGTAYAPRVDGWLFGAQAGYNWRIDRNWVFGLEGDFQWTGEKRSSSAVAVTPQIPEVGGDFNDVFTTTAAASWKFPWFATLRGRLGVLVDPTLLLYGTGGLAIGNFKYEFAGSVTCQRFGPGSTGTTPQATPCGARPGPGAPAVGTVALSDSETRLGLAVGAGLEKKFNRNWSAKAEYLYLDFGTRTFLSGSGFDTSVRLRDHIFRVGINYAFDAGPVVARY